jgi:hypothetical protein
VVQNGTLSIECLLKQSGNPNHPVCAAAVASHLFLDGAASPPVSGGELPASRSFTASMTAPRSDSDVLQQPCFRREFPHVIPTQRNLQRVGHSLHASPYVATAKPLVATARPLIATEWHFSTGMSAEFPVFFVAVNLQR